MPKRACICFTTNPDTVPAMYLFSAPNPGNAGNTKAFRSDDSALTERWIKAENRPGFAVYHCPNPLKPGATTHGKDSVDAIVAIFVDIDFKGVVETPEEIFKVLTEMQHLLAPSFIVESSHGYHFGYALKEPVRHNDPDFERVCGMQEVLITTSRPTHKCGRGHCCGYQGHSTASSSRTCNVGR